MRRIIVLLALVTLTALALSACSTVSPSTAVPAPTESPAQAPAAAPTVALDPNATVKVNSAVSIVDVVSDKNAVFASLSPDGKYMAYYLPGDRKTAGQICIYTFDSAAKKCTDLPLEQFLGYPYELVWSPDSSMITFTENPIDLGYDSHIWVFDMAAGTVTNITDNGVVGSWVRPTGTPSAVVDYLPAWGPTDGQIYFWRFQNQGEYMNFTLGLYKIDPAGGDPVEVLDMGQEVPRSLPMFTQERFFLDGPSEISPDGKNLAVLMSTTNDMGQGQVTLYRIPLDGSAPVVLMEPEAFSEAIPAWSGYPGTPGGISWTDDSKGVVTLAGTANSPTPFEVFYYTDVASGETTPLVDFSTLPTYDSYSEPLPGTSSTIPARWYSPWTGGLSPKGDKLLMINDLAGTIGLMSANLPPTGALPAISATADASTTSTASRTSRSADGKMTLYGLLLTVTE